MKNIKFLYLALIVIVAISCNNQPTSESFRKLIWFRKLKVITTCR